VADAPGDAPAVSAREAYEHELMQATHAAAGGDGLYGNYVASYEVDNG
jgi:hypothetical protein